MRSTLAAYCIISSSFRENDLDGYNRRSDFGFSPPSSILSWILPGSVCVKRIGLFLGRLSLLLFGLLLPLILLEFAVRLLGLAPPAIPNPTIWESHPDLGWWHIPDSGGTFYSSYNEFTTDVQVNELGLRDDAHLTGYEIAGRYKILILADSFGEALQVSLEQTFFKQLQRRLTEGGLPAQTLNAGVGSWGTDQALTYYMLEGRKFEPDLTLLFFFTRNDVVNNHAPLEIARNGGSIQKNFYQLDAQGNLIPPEPFDPERAYDNAPKPPSLPPAPLIKTADWLWLHSHLYRWLVPYLRDIPALVKALGPSGILGGEGRIRATHPAIPVPFYTYHQPPGDDWASGWALTEAILARLKQEVRADGGHLAVVIIPAREQVYLDEWARTVTASREMQALNWDLTLPNRQVGQILTSLQIPHLDLLTVFQATAGEAPSARLYFVHDGHWTEAGHTLAAEAIFQFLGEKNLLSPQQ